MAIARSRAPGVPDLFVAAPRYVGLRDIGRTICAWPRIDDRREVSIFRGWNCAPLLVRELLRGWGSTGVYQHRFWYAAMRRAVERLGPGVKCIIYPFENQPWEKLLCLAWRECAPHVRLIGYQHTSVQRMLLPFFFGEGEIDAAPLPDQIVTKGAVNLELLKEGGFPTSKLASRGALRYEYVHARWAAGSDASMARWRGREAGEATVLVALPISLPHATSLLLDLLGQFSKPLFLPRDGRFPVRFVLKCHPVLPIEWLHAGGSSFRRGSPCRATRWRKRYHGQTCSCTRQPPQAGGRPIWPGSRS